ncbi:universal stress protein [Novosphingobium sp.]|uniref:universal stress protein n=1 Tax=Novosphingobium sp. TaxID=1874826 RepID=UPI001ED65728|nr:universal stress protein [Novosphingobium sp.]MBK9009923.1 universal stress protein [Novosphingobium sp.]
MILPRGARTGGRGGRTILGEAADAQLIAMPTRGRHGLLDALRGSTTERVLAGSAFAGAGVAGQGLRPLRVP